MDLLRAGGGGAVPAAPDGTGDGAAVPLLGLSVDSRSIRARSAGAHVQYLAAAPRALDDWIVADPGGVAILPVVDAQIGGSRALVRCGVASHREVEQPISQKQEKSGEKKPIENGRGEGSCHNAQGAMAIKDKCHKKDRKKRRGHYERREGTCTMDGEPSGAGAERQIGAQSAKKRKTEQPGKIENEAGGIAGVNYQGAQADNFKDGQ